MLLTNMRPQQRQRYQTTALLKITMNLQLSQYIPD